MFKRSGRNRPAIAIVVFSAVTAAFAVAADRPAVAARAEIVHDWLMQDAGPQAEKLFHSASGNTLEAAVIAKIVAGFPVPVAAIDAELARLNARSSERNL